MNESSIKVIGYHKRRQRGDVSHTTNKAGHQFKQVAIKLSLKKP